MKPTMQVYLLPEPPSLKASPNPQASPNPLL